MRRAEADRKCQEVREYTITNTGGQSLTCGGAQVLLGGPGNGADDCDDQPGQGESEDHPGHADAVHDDRERCRRRAPHDVIDDHFQGPRREQPCDYRGTAARVRQHHANSREANRRRAAQPERPEETLPQVFQHGRCGSRRRERSRSRASMHGADTGDES